MKSCPASATELNCALQAAQTLIDNEWITIDYTAKQASGGTGVYIDDKGISALEVFDVEELRAEGLIDVARLSCIACGRCVELKDEYGDVSAALIAE